VLRFPLPILIPATAPHSASSVIRGWYNRPNSGRRTHSHPPPPRAPPPPKKRKSKKIPAIIVDVATKVRFEHVPNNKQTNKTLLHPLSSLERNRYTDLLGRRRVSPSFCSHPLSLKLLGGFRSANCIIPTRRQLKNSVD
jgi:hypothetical protein